jgi:hypothetical protein
MTPLRIYRRLRTRHLLSVALRPYFAAVSA